MSGEKTGGKTETLERIADSLERIANLLESIDDSQERIAESQESIAESLERVAGCVHTGVDEQAVVSVEVSGRIYADESPSSGR